MPRQSGGVIQHRCVAAPLRVCVLLRVARGYVARPRGQGFFEFLAGMVSAGNVCL